MRTLARCFAVLLIALVVSPVTAPFAACDLAALVSNDAHTDADSKLLNETTTTVAAFVDTFTLIDHSAVAFASTSARVAHSCQAAPSVLRL